MTLKNARFGLLLGLCVVLGAFVSVSGPVIVRGADAPHTPHQPPRKPVSGVTPGTYSVTVRLDAPYPAHIAERVKRKLRASGARLLARPVVSKPVRLTVAATGTENATSE